MSPNAFENLRPSCNWTAAVWRSEVDACATERGVVMMGEHKPALLEPAEQPQPVAGLLTALAGETTPMVPATAHTRALIAILPLPTP